MYNQFDDIMLLSEGLLVFHGPREEVCVLSCEWPLLINACILRRFFRDPLPIANLFSVVRCRFCRSSSRWDSSCQTAR